MGFKKTLYKRYSIVFIASVVFVSVIIIYFTQKILSDELKEKCNLIASILSTVTADAVLTYDYVTLERYINELIKKNDFAKIKITKSDGTLVAEVESEKKIKHVYNLEYPVMIDNDRIGTIYISYSRDKVDRVLINIIIGSILFVLLIHFFGLFINNKLIDQLIFKPIKTLTEATQEIKKGNYEFKIDTGTKDEFSELADAMNKMSETIKQTFNEITLNKSKLEAIVENIADGIFVTDLDERIIEFNKSAEKITGYKKEEVLGRFCEEIFKTDLCHETCALRNKNKIIINKESTFITKDGNQRIASVSSALIKDNDGNIIAGVQTFKDITEEKEQQATYFHTEKMVTIGEMASAIAHEVNNPLSNIIGYSKLLIINKNLSYEEMLDKLKIINEQALKAANIVQELLNFSRRSDRKKQIFNIEELIKNIIKITSIYSYNKDISIKLETTEDNFLMKHDPTKLEQVIFNLVLNSIHAIEQKGEIIIKLSKDNKFIIIEVIDNGKGIEDKHIKDIFQPFFTTKPKGKGTGLGLFIVKTIIKELGGEITVQSKIDHGTTFRILIPEQT